MRRAPSVAQQANGVVVLRGPVTTSFLRGNKFCPTSERNALKVMKAATAFVLCFLVCALSHDAVASGQCLVEVEETVATEARYGVASVMGVPMRAADVVQSSLASYAEIHGLTAADMAPLSRDSDVQKSLVPILTSFDLLFTYVGFADGTHIMVKRNDDGSLSGAYRPAGDDQERALYDLDPSTGEQVGEDTASKLYDPRERPWYIQAQSAGAASWSGAYVYASSGEVGNSFALPVYDEVSGDLAYVIGVDASLTGIADVLTSATAGGSGGGVAFAMDGDGYLYGTNQGAAVAISTDSAELVFAPSLDNSVELSPEHIIAEVSLLVLEASFLSDSTFATSALSATVRRWSSGAGLDLYVVAAMPAVADATIDDSCTLTVSRDLSGYGRAELSAVLESVTSVVDTISSTMNLGLMTVEAGDVLLNSSLQTQLWGLSKAFCEAEESAVFVGFPDDTFIAFVCDKEFGSSPYVGLKLSDGGNDQTPFLNFYHIDATTGTARVSDGILATYNYHPTARDWFTTAVDAAQPTFSEPYVFYGLDVVGITYAAPVLDAETGDVLCIVGADLYVSERLNDVLAPLNKYGHSLFAMDSLSSEIVGTSSGLPLSNETSDASDEGGCSSLFIDETVAVEGNYAVQSVMGVPMQVADVVQSSLASYAEIHGLTAADMAPLSRDSDVQKSLVPILTSFDLLFTYVGFADGTHIMVKRNDDGSLSGAYRPAGDDQERALYDLDPSTGEQVGEDTASKLYDPRERPWYIQAQSAGAASWSGAYVYASSGEVGNSFALPVYDEVSGDLAYVIGVDASLAGIAEALENSSEGLSDDFVAYVCLLAIVLSFELLLLLL